MASCAGCTRHVERRLGRSRSRARGACEKLPRVAARASEAGALVGDPSEVELDLRPGRAARLAASSRTHSEWTRALPSPSGRASRRRSVLGRVRSARRKRKRLSERDEAVCPVDVRDCDLGAHLARCGEACDARGARRPGGERDARRSQAQMYSCATRARDKVGDAGYRRRSSRQMRKPRKTPRRPRKTPRKPRKTRKSS